MISATESVFPNNIVELLMMRMQNIDADLFVTSRPLRPSDPAQSIGVFGSIWTPDDESYEMRNVAASEPTLQRYILTAQGFIKHGDEELGLAIHSVLSQRMRAVLYRDEPLRLALAGLSVTYSNGAKESLKRWGIGNQRYLTNEIDSRWLYLANLELWFETENS